MYPTWRARRSVARGVFIARESGDGGSRQSALGSDHGGGRFGTLGLSAHKAKARAFVGADRTHHPGIQFGRTATEVGAGGREGEGDGFPILPGGVDDQAEVGELNFAFFAVEAGGEPL